MERRLDWMLKEVRFYSGSAIQLPNCVNLNKSHTLLVLCSKLFIFALGMNNYTTQWLTTIENKQFFTFLTCEKMDHMHVCFQRPLHSRLKRLSLLGHVSLWQRGKKIGSWQHHMVTFKVSVWPQYMQCAFSCQWLKRMVKPNVNGIEVYTSVPGNACYIGMGGIN